MGERHPRSMVGPTSSRSSWGGGASNLHHLALQARVLLAGPSFLGDRQNPAENPLNSEGGVCSGIFSVMFRRAPGKSETTFVKQN